MLSVDYIRLLGDLRYPLHYLMATPAHSVGQATNHRRQQHGFVPGHAKPVGQQFNHGLRPGAIRHGKVCNENPQSASPC